VAKIEPSSFLKAEAHPLMKAYGIDSHEVETVEALNCKKITYAG